MAAEVDRSRFVLPIDTNVCSLDCKKAFEGLSHKEKLFAHYLSRASWYGSLICLLQTSPESPGIYLLLRKIFSQQTVDELQNVVVSTGKLTSIEFQAFVVYAAGIFANLGNYKSFGDTKIVPDLTYEQFESLVKCSKAYQQDEEVQKLLDRVGQKIFSLSTREQQLELGEKGISTYFSINCEVKDAELAQQFLNSKDLSAYNTRLFKYEEDGKLVYEVCLASSSTSGMILIVLMRIVADELDKNDDVSKLLGTHLFTSKDHSEPIHFKITRGDYSGLMKLLADNLENAKKYASNETEVSMLTKYIDSFKYGSIPAHKEGSRFWIRNKGPIVELYVGFIESYRDPFGVRGEFEGFVAMVNKSMSAKLAELVNRAEHFLPLLPWPSSYEKDEFQRPDFTSLDVLTFASSGIPAGINIPNYDDIRQTEGFKNVSLGNVIAAGYKESKITFLSEKDIELYTEHKIESFEVQVGLHELLGHGSGKLFQKDSEGKLNFDVENIKHIETGQKISSWYEHGETWSSKFQSMAASYEECRAECVGIYLCLSSEIISIFGHHGSKADDIIYINWLNMVRAGLLGLEFYSPEKQIWGQAHMQARFVILRVLLSAGEDLVTIQKTIGVDGEPDIVIRLDRSKINTVGKTAIGNFLRKLQLYKATADYEKGKALYDWYSDVNDHDVPHFLSLRNIVLKRKLPRKMFVQCNTRINGENVDLIEYDCSLSGLIQSINDRFPNGEADDIVQLLWEKDAKHF